MTTKKSKIPWNKRVTLLSARTERHKMMTPARGKDHHPWPQQARVVKYWDRVNGGDLKAREVQERGRLEVEYLNKMKVVERVPYSSVKHSTGKEPIKVKCVDTLTKSRIHRSRLVAKEFRRGSKFGGITNFSATPPLE